MVSHPEGSVPSSASLQHHAPQLRGFSNRNAPSRTSGGLEAKAQLHQLLPLRLQVCPASATAATLGAAGLGEGFPKFPSSSGGPRSASRVQTSLLGRRPVVLAWPRRNAPHLSADLPRPSLQAQPHNLRARPSAAATLSWGSTWRDGEDRPDPVHRLPDGVTQGHLQGTFQPATQLARAALGSTVPSGTPGARASEAHRWTPAAALVDWTAPCLLSCGAGPLGDGLQQRQRPEPGAVWASEGPASSPRGQHGAGGKRKGWERNGSASPSPQSSGSRGLTWPLEETRPVQGGRQRTQARCRPQVSRVSRYVRGDVPCESQPRTPARRLKAGTLEKPGAPSPKEPGGPRRSRCGAGSVWGRVHRGPC